MYVTSLRGKYLLRLLGQADQLVATSESLAADPLLEESERQIAAAKLAFGRDAVERDEKMLGQVAK